MHIEHATLGEDGKLFIPSALRQELGLQPGDTVVIESDGDSLLLHGCDHVRREIQESVTGS